MRFVRCDNASCHQEAPIVDDAFGTTPAGWFDLCLRIKGDPDQSFHACSAECVQAVAQQAEASARIVVKG